MKIRQLSRAIGIILAGLSVASTASEKVFYPNGHSYQRIDTQMTWHQARAKCASLGGYLATITSPEENQFVYENFSRSDRVWLGGTDEGHEGVWRWITGEAWGYIHWHPGEPNNAWGGENFLEIWLHENGTWNDARPDAQLRPFVCEWNLSPVANFTASLSSGRVPLKVTLDATASNDPDGTITQYQWVSSDEQSAPGRIAILTFNIAGTYNITLTVTDNNGATSQKTMQISVQPQKFTLTVIKDGSGTGTVSSTPTGIDCSSDCTEDYISGTTVELTAIPDSNSTFAGWNGDCDDTNNPITVTMDAAKTCTAIFPIAENEDDFNNEDGSDNDSTDVPDESTDCKHAVYLLKGKTLTLPVVELPVVDLWNGQPTAEVEQWTGVLKQKHKTTNRFRVLSKTVFPITDGFSSTCPATYSLDTGVLSIPYIDVPTAVTLGKKFESEGVEVFKATLRWEPQDKVFVVQEIEKLP